MGPSLYIIILVCGLTLTAGITTDDGSAAKRTAEHSGVRAQSRHIQTGPNQNHHHFSNANSRQSVRRVRPSLPAPPYAVQMEPLVQYSQRDPLYHQRQELINLTRDNSIEEKVHRIDHDPDGTSLAESYGVPSGQNSFDQNYHQHYYREPEPIIEIIIKESNESLPAPPPPPVQPVKPTKEPVHVFYVKYKKNPKGKGEDDIIYEAPIPAITPPTEQLEHDSSPQVSDIVHDTVTLAPPPSTTLRTIIHPDSEVYHGSGLKVTFGETEVKNSDAAYEESNAAEPSIALPQKEAQSRESSDVNIHSPIKRQGTYQTIPQEVYDRNPPKAQPSASIQAFSPQPGKFQHNSFRQQNLQTLQFPQPLVHQPKVNVPRQVPIQQQPAFRPQHTGNVFNNQQHNYQQSFHQPQYQQQASQVQQRQVPRQQNPYSTLQSPSHNIQQQRPQFREQPQQFDHRPVHFSQPLNSPAHHQAQNPVPSQDPQLIRQQQLAQQQQQSVQSQYRNQPINIPNQDFSRYNQQPFQGSQPLNTPVPLPSKPIHPLFAHHYQQQISLAQQQRQNIVPSTHQPQQQLPPSYQGVQRQQQYQQQYRFPQQTVNIAHHSTSQPLHSYELTTPSSITNKIKSQDVKHSSENFPDGQVIKAISHSEEHQLQPQYNHQNTAQYNQDSAQYNHQNTPQYNQEPSIDQANQLRQHLRSQNIGQFQQQLSNQPPSNQQINQQIYNQQQNQHRYVESLSNQQHTSKNNQHITAQFSHPNQPLSTTSQPAKSTTASYHTKYNQVYSHSPSTTPTPTQETPTSTTEDPEKEKEKQKKFNENLAALPDEVPDDIREQLLSSGILSNADISILDYDKVGDIPIENLPPEALENFYGAGSAPVPAIVAPDADSSVDSEPSESKDVEMKVVRYDPSTKEGQKVEQSYIKDDATQVDSVILNDSKYNRYLPLKVSGANFPLPDVSVLAGKRVNSVVVLAPVDYDFVKEAAEEEEERTGRSSPVQVQGVRFIAGNVLKNLIKDPTEENYKSWLAKEKMNPADRQSVVLLVVSSEGSAEKDKEIFMYDISSEKLSRLRGELSTTFVEVAESNASSQELDGLSDTEGAASALQPIRVPAPPGLLVSKVTRPLDSASVPEDLSVAASETVDSNVYQAPTISTGYSKMAVQ